MVRIKTHFLEAVCPIEQARRLAGDWQTILNVAHFCGLQECRDIVVDIDDFALGNIVI
jgi:hypothetical protein